jgi:xylulokinase
MADVLDRQIRRVDQPLHANTRGAALLAAIALKRATLDDVARAVAITDVFEPDPATRRISDRLYREFRALHKQNRKIYARLNARGRTGHD